MNIILVNHQEVLEVQEQDMDSTWMSIDKQGWMHMEGHTKGKAQRELLGEGALDLSFTVRKVGGTPPTEEEVGQGHIPIPRRDDGKWVRMMIGLSFRAEIGQTH